MGERKVEYEYNIRTTKHGQKRIMYTHWCNEEDMVDMCLKNSLKEVKDTLPEGWTLVKRPKAGEITNA